MLIFQLLLLLLICYRGMCCLLKQLGFKDDFSLSPQTYIAKSSNALFHCSSIILGDPILNHKGQEAASGRRYLWNSKLRRIFTHLVGIFYDFWFSFMLGQTRLWRTDSRTSLETRFHG